MGNDLNIEHPVKNGSGRIVQQIVALRRNDCVLKQLRCVDSDIWQTSRTFVVADVTKNPDLSGRGFHVA
jgi:hypothetical protein